MCGTVRIRAQSYTDCSLATLCLVVKRAIDEMRTYLKEYMFMYVKEYQR